VSLSGYKMPVFCERKHFSVYLFERERERERERESEQEREREREGDKE